jgi:hypothetical protein
VFESDDIAEVFGVAVVMRDFGGHGFLRSGVDRS